MLQLARNASVVSLLALAFSCGSPDSADPVPVSGEAPAGSSESVGVPGDLVAIPDNPVAVSGDPDVMPNGGSGEGSSAANPADQASTAPASPELGDSGELPTKDDELILDRPTTEDDAPISSEESCAEGTATAEPIPSTVQMVIDTSGSMAWAPGTMVPPMAGELSKWDITREALKGAVAELPPTVAVGVNFFPNAAEAIPGLYCIENEIALPIGLLGPPGSDQRMAFSNALDGLYPVGGTPTHAAYRFGEQAVTASALPGHQFVLLITDGFPTFSIECEGDGSTPIDNSVLIAEVAASRQDVGVSTFVIGSPGSEEARGDLSRMAMAGGTESPGCSEDGPDFCHLDLTTAPDFGAALTSGLANISGQIVTCQFEVPPAPSGETLDPQSVNVLYTGSDGVQTSIPQDATGDCMSGWQYDDPEAPSLVQLCGTDCDALKADPGAKIDLLFGCETKVGVVK